MATLSERHDLSRELLDRTRVALAAALTDVLLLKLSSASTDQAKKELRIQQQWAERTLSNINPVVEKVALMVASKAGDAVIADGISDEELLGLVEVGVTVLSAVHLHAPDVALPA